MCKLEARLHVGQTAFNYTYLTEVKRRFCRLCVDNDALSNKIKIVGLGR